jgi:hypothetical protein
MSLPLASTASTCPSHFLLDQWVLGELERDSRLEVERHIDHCQKCQTRLSERRESEADFVVELNTLRALQPATGSDLEDHVGTGATAPHKAAAPASKRTSRVARWAQRGLNVAVTGAAAAGLALAVFTSGGGSDATDGNVSAGDVVDDGAPVRTKGSAQSALFVQDERGVRGLFLDGDSGPASVHSGDTLQVAVTSSTDAFVAVMSSDGAGQLSTYVATGDGGLVRVSAGRNVPLPQATLLDDVVGPETVAVFVCKDATIHTSALHAVVLDGAPPAGCRVDRYRLDKKAGH